MRLFVAARCIKEHFLLLLGREVRYPNKQLIFQVATFRCRLGIVDYPEMTLGIDKNRKNTYNIGSFSKNMIR